MNKDNSYPSEEATRAQEILGRTECELAHHPVQVFDWAEQQVGTVLRIVEASDGEMGRCAACRNAGESAFSIAPTMRRCWLCVCIQSFFAAKGCRRD